MLFFISLNRGLNIIKLFYYNEAVLNDNLIKSFHQSRKYHPSCFTVFSSLYWDRERNILHIITQILFFCIDRVYT